MTTISAPYVDFYSMDFENSFTGGLLRAASHRVPTGIREGHLKRQPRERPSWNGWICSQNARPWTEIASTRFARWSQLKSKSFIVFSSGLCLERTCFLGGREALNTMASLELNERCKKFQNKRILSKNWGFYAWKTTFWPMKWRLSAFFNWNTWV